MPHLNTVGTCLARLLAASTWLVVRARGRAAAWLGAV